MSAAQLNLGLLYAEGRGGLPRDEAQAVAWYRKAAEQNLPLAQLMLGLAYVHGRGLPHDDRQAFQWFERAAASGSALAQYGVGMLYSDGRGVKQDAMQAYLWLSLSASGGYIGAAQPLDAVTGRLSADELTRAQQLARDWRTANAAQDTQGN